MKQLTAIVADFVSNTNFADIQEDCIKIAENQVVDYFGVNIAGSKDQTSRIMREIALENGSKGKSIILGTTSKVSADIAALINGTQAHSLDYDDVNQSMYGHPTAAILPAVLATAQKINCSGKRILESYIIGVEVAAKLGRIINPAHYERGWHATCTLGSIGAAVGVSKLLNFTSVDIQKAIGIAASFAGGLSQNFGTMTKPLHAGRAAENGVRAAILVQKGWTSNTSILDSESGFYSAFLGNNPHLENWEAFQLGDPYDMVSPGIIVKKYPSCAFTHPVIDAVLELVSEHVIPAETVERITVGINSTATKTLLYSEAKTDLEAKFCIEYCVASAFLRKSSGLRCFTTSEVLTDDVQKLMRKVRRAVLPHDPSIENIFGPNEVTIQCSGNLQFTKKVNIAKGDPRKPLTSKEVYAKYQDCLSSSYSKKVISDSYIVLTKIKHLDKIDELFKIYMEE